ncbi:ABC transporter ATP-binding protein [Halosimplex sp. J119]
MTHKLETDGLTYRTADETVFEDVSVAVETGETVAVVGPSGVGKSTFLRLLVRLDEPIDGTVYYEGRDYREMDPQTLRKRVGLVPQHSALVDGTVRENVTLGPRLRGESVDKPDVTATLDQLGLPNTADRAVETLSGGEKQRVAIARTLLNEPEVLLLDEPTGSLDAETERTVEAFLGEISENRSLTCVVVTHDRRQAERLASRALVFSADGVEATSIERLGEVVG